MEKLLHERLRECGLYNYITDEDCSVTACSKCEQLVANKIADEIEKYYIPRPRFEDGELACENDVFVDSLGDDHTISLIETAFRIWDTDNCFVRYNNLLKRHELKILDADGVEIKVGDTVWDLDSGEKLTVVEFANREHGIIQCSNEEDEYYSDHDAHRLTHREPDSLEKLRDDLRDLVPFMPADEFMVNACDLISITNRLTAIMERDI